MLRTFNAVVQEDKIQWREDDAKYVPSSQPARVLVTFLDDLPENAPRDRAERRAAAMRILSTMQASAGLAVSPAPSSQPLEHRPLKR